MQLFSTLRIFYLRISRALWLDHVTYGVVTYTAIRFDFHSKSYRIHKVKIRPNVQGIKIRYIRITTKSKKKLDEKTKINTILQ